MASLVTSHKRSYDSSSDKENPSPTPIMCKKQKSTYDLVSKSNRSHVHSMLQAQARQAERDILTPPPSSEIDVDIVHRRSGPLPSSQPRSSALSSSPLLHSSSSFLPTDPIREDEHQNSKRPTSFGTLDINFDGSHNLVLGRSRKTCSSGSSKKLLASQSSLPKHLRSTDKETRLVPLPRKAQHTSRNHILLLVDERGYLMVHVLGQNGCRLQVLGARLPDAQRSPLQEGSSGLGKRYTAGRVVTVRPPDASDLEGQGNIVVDVEIDMYSCRTIIHWLVPTVSKFTEAGEGGMQDEEKLSELEEERSRSFTPEAPLGQYSRLANSHDLDLDLDMGMDVVAPLSPPTSSPRRLSPVALETDDIDMGDKMDEDIFRDLPPSSPPLEMDDLPILGANEDEDETEDETEAQRVIARPVEVVEVISRPSTPVAALSTPMVIKPAMPIKSRDFAAIPKPSSFGHSDMGMFGFLVGGPSRKPQVMMTKVMVKAPLIAPVARSREATPRVEVDKPKIAKPKARFSENKETGARVSFAPDTEKVVPKKVIVATPKPAVQVQEKPSPLEMESIPETIMPPAFVPLLTPTIPSPTEHIVSEPISVPATAAMDPPSSPARSIYSQMTSSSEDESDSPHLGQVEKRIIIERLRATASPAHGMPTSTPGASGSGSSVSKGVKREIMDDAERKEKKTKRKIVDKEGKVRAVKKKMTQLKASDVDANAVGATSKVSAPVTPAAEIPETAAANASASFENGAATTAPAPPPDLDLIALTATSVVFSGVSAISALDLVKTILDSQPSMRSIGTDIQWAEWIGDTLRSSEMFGRVDRKGKDSSGHPLLPLYHYVPSSDPDPVRAKELGSCMRPLRGVQRGGGKAIDWRPVGSRGRR